MMNPKEHGIESIVSAHSVDETVARLVSLLNAKGISLFATIDHSGEAAKTGLSMPNTKLLIFGNPTAGTPLMLAAPSMAIDLPLKALVAESDSGVTISWNDPHYLRERHGFPEKLIANIAGIEGLLRKAAE